MNEFRLQTDTVSSGVRLGTTGSAALMGLGPFGPAWSELIRGSGFVYAAGGPTVSKLNTTT
jgi:hypothetical protein